MNKRLGPAPQDYAVFAGDVLVGLFEKYNDALRVYRRASSLLEKTKTKKRVILYYVATPEYQVMDCNM